MSVTNLVLNKVAECYHGTHPITPYVLLRTAPDFQKAEAISTGILQLLKFVICNLFFVDSAVETLQKEKLWIAIALPKGRANSSQQPKKDNNGKIKE